MYSVKIPALLDNNFITIQIDVIENDILLISSKS